MATEKRDNTWKHLDLFSGYGGFTIPASKYNIRTIGFSEIDKYATAVLRRRFPTIRNFGDVSRIDPKELPDSIDLITGGTPCQDLSIAGKGAGLDGERSGLFFEFIRIVRAVKPRYFVWENVKGALSSNAGWDLARVQIEMESLGYSLQWKILNAKDFGVPQNRERIFIIGIRGESRGEVFPKQIGSGTPVKRVKDVRKNVSDAERVYSPEGSSPTLKGLGGGMGAKTGLYAVPATVKKETDLESVRLSDLGKENANALSARDYKGMRRSLNVVAVLSPDRKDKKQNGRRFKGEEESMFTLTGQDRHGVALRVQGDKDKRKVYTSDEMGALAANPSSDALPKVAMLQRPRGTNKGGIKEKVAPGLTQSKWQDNNVLIEDWRVRRLTPIECERLMGLPDDWTSQGIIDNKEVDISDTQRYKMCGNGVVVTVVDHIYKFLRKYDEDLLL